MREGGGMMINMEDKKRGGVVLCASNCRPFLMS